MKLVCDVSITGRMSHPRNGAALRLDFARQHYSLSGHDVALSSVFGFSRGSNAFQGGEAGILERVGPDILRRDHQFGSGAFRGVLIEPAGTNMLAYSSDFTQTYWSAYAAKPVFGSGYTAPDGSLDALAWTCSQTTGGAGGQRGGILVVDAAVTATATASVWLRASAPLDMRFGHSDATSQQITVTPDWQRFTYTNVLPNGQNRIFMLYEDSNEDIEVQIWGAQLELGSTATSLIDSMGSAATRSADLPGLIGLTGTFDVTVTYDDDSQETWPAEAVGDGWWPALSRRWVKRLDLW
jgi:hypothetical protein